MAVRKMIATAHADLLSSVVQENTFRKIADGLYVQVASRRSGGVLHGIFVADSRNPAYELVYYAREGAVDENGSALVMKDGEVHRKLPDGNVSIIKFDSYAFDLTDLTQDGGRSDDPREGPGPVFPPQSGSEGPGFREKPDVLFGRTASPLHRMDVSPAVRPDCAGRQQRCPLAPRSPRASDDYGSLDLSFRPLGDLLRCQQRGGIALPSSRSCI